jgi:integrase
MAMIRQRASGTWEIRVPKKGVLPRDHYATANTEAEAKAYAATIENMLAQGVVPLELMQQDDAAVQSVEVWLRQYLVKVHISDSDNRLLNALLSKAGTWRTTHVNMAWAQAWVSEMKQIDKLTPGSIRHKVGAVARCLDWCVNNGWLAVNPLRALPKRYASYTPSDGDKRVDVERDRRLQPGEYERIITLLETDTRIKDRPAWRLLFILAIETGMRLREMYTLTSSQVDIQNRTIFLDKTKNGDKRQVPLSSVALSELAAWGCKDEFIFPFWNGKTTSLRLTTMRLSQKWARIAAWAGCEDLHFHDIRHEAACRIYLMTKMPELQIRKMFGWRSVSSQMRYSNLRGSELADWLL